MLDHSQTPYADAVAAFADIDWLRLATPGHQTSTQGQPALAHYFGERLLALDVAPFVDGIDFGTNNPLNQSLALAADAWGARKTWFLSNGASKGNLMACLAMRNFGTDIVVQRSVHSSVIDGLALSGLDATFVNPSIVESLGIANGVTVESLTEALDRTPSAVAAYVVTPSYFGATADIAALAQVAHSRGVPLIVDEAWGAHFGFHPELPVNANRLGADLVISSTHKLGGSLTQSAMLHLSHGEFADALEPLLDRAFKSMQSTSASALLQASLDIARKQLAHEGKHTIGASISAAQEIRDGIVSAGRFRDAYVEMATYPDVFALDPLRITIDLQAGGISGHQARSDMFHKFNLYCEMATNSTIVMLIGAGNQPDVERTLKTFAALPELDAQRSPVLTLPAAGDRITSVREAYFAQTEVVTAKEAIGRVSADSVAAYPPGIPNLLPGELITEETVDFLQATLAEPFGHVRGGSSTDMSTFRVVVD